MLSESSKKNMVKKEVKEPPKGLTSCNNRKNAVAGSTILIGRDQSSVMETPLKYPDSCCKTEKEGCGQLSSVGEVSDKLYTEGCEEKLKDLLKNALYVVFAIGITIVVIQILGMIFALVLICTIGKEGTFA